MDIARPDIARQKRKKRLIYASVGVVALVAITTLVPEEIRWLAARTQGRVERIVLRPGAVVTPKDVTLILSNPMVTQAAVDAESELTSAEAELVSLNVQLERSVLDAEANLAVAKSGRGRRR